MQNGSLVVLWIIIFILIYTRNKKRRFLNILRIKRKKKGRGQMSHIIEKFIGKDCLINLGSGSNADGTVKSVVDGWVEIEGKNGDLQAVNVDYICRIREYPKSKNGKRKIVVE